MAKILCGLSCFLMGIGLLFHVIGLAVPSWSVNDSNSSIGRGLWEQCNPDCESYDSASVRPIILLVMIAMALGFLGFAMFACMLFCGCQELCCCGRGPQIALAATSTTTLFTITAAIIWSASIHKYLDDYHIGAGYGLCLAGSLFIGLGGLVAWATVSLDD